VQRVSSAYSRSLGDSAENRKTSVFMLVNSYWKGNKKGTIREKKTDNTDVKEGNVNSCSGDSGNLNVEGEHKGGNQRGELG